MFYNSKLLPEVEFVNASKLAAEQRIKVLQSNWLLQLLHANEPTEDEVEVFIDSFTKELQPYFDDGVWPESLHEEVESFVDIVLHTPFEGDAASFVSSQVDIRGVQDRFYVNLIA